MNNELLSTLGFSLCRGIGVRSVFTLIERTGSVEAAYRASASVLIETIGKRYAEKILNFRNRVNLQSEYKRLQNLDITPVSYWCSIYPSQLKHLSDPPYCLYAKGNLQLLRMPMNSMLSVVGTRSCSSYGIQVARTYARALAERGITIVSGMARGIDGEAQWGCLNGGGTTIAVLGNGVDVAVPASHARLYRSILENNGLILSEYPPGEPAFKGTFVARNRIIAGLSSAVLVVEGAPKSGSLITAQFAIDLGREVLVIPGNVTSAHSLGTNKLIQSGAMLIAELSDITDANYLLIKNKYPATRTNTNKIDEEILESLSTILYTKDELISLLDMQPSEVLQRLTYLELEGVICKNSEGKYYVM